MALATILTGYYMACARPFDVKTSIIALIGSAFVGGGANALNQYFERDLDAGMKRTQDRPLPSQRLGEREALWFSVFLSLTGLGILFFGVNRLTGLIGLLTLSVYVFLYTPLKQKTSANTLIGALSGAAPCLIGWTAASGRLGRGALVLFIILFVWQLPHFFAIARIYREDYQRAGLRMMTAPILLYSAVLLPVSLVPARIGMTGNFYPAASQAAGAAFLTFALYMTLTKLSAPKKFIPASILYLTLLIAIMVFDKA